MTVSADALDVALRVAGALEQVGAGYFVGGSFASSLDGEPRATNDIDFVIDLKVGKIADFVAALGPDFEVDVDMLRDAVLHGRSANAFYLPLVLKIDFFGHPHGPYDDSEFNRRRPVVVRDGRSIFVKAPEDTVLRKLLWFRAGGVRAAPCEVLGDPKRMWCTWRPTKAKPAPSSNRNFVMCETSASS